MPQLTLIDSLETDAINDFMRHSLKNWGLDEHWHHQYVSWGQIQSFLKDVIFKKTDAAIVQVGTTWVSGLVGLKALRPFKPLETAYIEQAGNFLPIAWNTSMPLKDNQVWSIPWSSDVRVVYYWADMFEEAQVDPQMAFQDIPSFEAALEQLQSHGIQTPWIDTTDEGGNSVYRAGMWIWAHGGDYLSSDGRQSLFTEPSAMAGLQEYFGLDRFVPKTAAPLNEQNIVELFHQRKVACIITGQWLINIIRRDPMSNLLSRLGASLPPAPPFVGGTHLVVMNHLAAQFEEAAVELIAHLSSKQFAIDYGSLTRSHFPMRADLLDLPEVAKNPYADVLFKALQCGRTLPAATRWSIVEEALVREFSRIRATIKAHPDRPLKTIIESHLEPLAKRLNRTLAV
jgi:ABC-type glycerol-3-phosphate transport system substrate-binding protein